jgi:AraC-like DNA-binding protein/ActR/RegA family two-component response regulator
MVAKDERRASLYDVVAGARNFLWTVALAGDADVDTELETFVEIAGTSPVKAFERKAVLIELLTFLDKYTGDRLPSLADRFIQGCRRGGNSLALFGRCVHDAFRLRRIYHPVVQQAISIIDGDHGNADISSASLAQRLNVRQSSLDFAFKHVTGHTPGDYIREVRLVRARALLVRSTKSIKEIWGEVGYKDASTFDHHFKKRFEMTPSECRRRAIVPPETAAAYRAGALSADRRIEADANPLSILIVDDDEGVRVTSGRFFRMQGYTVHLAASGHEALREVHRTQPDIILLDLHMPAMSGLECLASLRQTHNGRAAAVAVVTADWFADELEDEIHALNATIHNKLCDPETIHELVRQLAASRPHAAFGGDAPTHRHA